MNTVRAELANLPFVVRFIICGAIVIGVLGAITGLVIGLFAYPPTAVVAVVEVGIPATLAGGLLGAVVGVVAFVVRKIASR